MCELDEKKLPFSGFPAAGFPMGTCPLWWNQHRDPDHKPVLFGFLGDIGSRSTQKSIKS